LNDERQKVFRINGTDYPKQDFVHLKGAMLPGSVDGLDPVTYQRVTLGLAASMDQFSANLFTNGAVLSGVVEATGASGDTGVDRKRARDIAMQFEARHAGVANAHKVGVLFDATWKPLAISPENAQFLASKAFVREEIAGWFGVPLQRLMVITKNASQGGGKGLDSIDQGYATHTLLPLARQIESEWDRMVPGGFGTWTEFDFSGLLRASALERAQIQNLRRVAATATVNENRQDEGLPALSDPRADDPFMPLNSNTSTAFPTDATTGDDPEPTDNPQDGTHEDV
jgi:HK97 family phage portal protein